MARVVFFLADKTEPTTPWSDELKRLILITIGALVSAGAAHADSARACYAISDMDRHALCIAKSRKEPGICYVIQRADLRAACLAEVRW